MKFSDPFGRLENRHQRGYVSMRDLLRNGGINTPEAALAIIRHSKERAQKFIAVAVAVSLLAALLWPEGIAVTLCLVLFFAVWVITSALNGQRYIRRYIDEELNSKQEQQNEVSPDDPPAT